MDTLNITSILLANRKFWATYEKITYYNASDEWAVKSIEDNGRQSKVRKNKQEKETSQVF